MSVDLPTLGGPTIAITIGGGSSEDLSTSGMLFRFSLISWVLFLDFRSFVKIAKKK
jgi:hypothetical protein